MIYSELGLERNGKYVSATHVFLAQRFIIRTYRVGKGKALASFQRWFRVSLLLRKYKKNRMEDEY